MEITRLSILTNKGKEPIFYFPCKNRLRRHGYCYLEMRYAMALALEITY
jgi:hypothetical protein